MRNMRNHATKKYTKLWLMMTENDWSTYGYILPSVAVTR